MKYFSNLKNGWADLTIGDFSCPCSYIQNIPLIILNAYKDFKKNEYCIIDIDSEGYGNEIIITTNGVHIFVYRNARTDYYNLSKIYDTYTKKFNLLKDLCNDIIDNIEEWAKWLCITKTNNTCYDKIIEEYKKNILSYAEKENILPRNN